MYIFIVNPLSGHGKTLVVWLKIEKLLLKQRIPYTMLPSILEVGTKEFITEQLKLRKINAVAIIGGDGTISSVIQELAETNIPTAIFPAGSGNDTARMFRLTNNPMLFLTGLLDGQGHIN